MRKQTITYAYRQHGTVTVLPKVKSLRALLINTPHLATPGHWDERAGEFTPLSTARGDFGGGEE